MRAVAPVPRLCERVRAERLELLGREELLDGGGHLLVGVDEVEVVHDLAALVTEVALVLETTRTAHEPENLPLTSNPRRVAIGCRGYLHHWGLENRG